MKLFLTIFTIGIKPDNSVYLNSKIKICNQIALFLVFLGLFYGTLSLFYIPWVGLFPYCGALVALLSFWLNFRKRYYLSRFLMAIGALVLDSLYHAYNIEKGNHMIHSLYFSQISFALFPWVLADIREKKLLVPTVLICIFFLGFQPWLNDLLEVSESLYLFKQNWVNYISTFASIIILVICLLSFQIKNYSDEQDLVRARDDVENTLQELKKTQEKMIQQEKMASLGILIAGIAHEINNPLNFIRNGVIYLKEYLVNPGNADVQETINILQGIDEGVQRVADIVQSLRSYSWDSDKPAQKCLVQDIIDNCLNMLHGMYKNRISIIKQYPNNTYVLMGNEGKLHQVFLSILTNALDSITGNGKIVISITVENDDLAVVIKDDGSGIPEEHMSRIFDPFFTTKKPGSGMGLGLSLAYQFIKEHNGQIDIISGFGEGTTVTIHLPLDENTGYK